MRILLDVLLACGFFVVGYLVRGGLVRGRPRVSDPGPPPTASGRYVMDPFLGVVRCLGCGSQWPDCVRGPRCA